MVPASIHPILSGWNCRPTRRSRTQRLQALRRSKSWNNELRRRLLLVHQTYVEMAKGVVGDLERFDVALRESAQDAHSTIEAQTHWEEAAPAPQAPAQNGAVRANGARPKEPAPAA
jgi:hypothetical protein